MQAGIINIIPSISPSFVGLDDPIWKVWKAIINEDLDCILVVKDSCVLGVIKKDDVRQYSISSSYGVQVKDLMRENFLVSLENEALQNILAKCLIQDTEFIVVLDDKNNLINLFSIKELLSQVFQNYEIKSLGTIGELTKKAREIG